MIIDDYIGAFGKYSYNNSLYARSSFHIILGQILKDLSIRKGAIKIDPRVNLFLLQDSGSGKTTPYDFIYKLAEALDLRIRSVDDFSDSALIGTIEQVTERIDGGTVTDYIVTDGLLATSDIIHWDEASALLKPKQHQTSAISFFQKTLNPIGSATNMIYKKLAHGPPITISPSCSFLLTSYFPDNIVHWVTTTGFFQRLLTCPRRLSANDRFNNSMNDIDLLGTVVEDNDVTFGRIVDELSEIRNFGQQTNIIFPNSIKPALKNRVKQYLDIVHTPNEAISRLLHTFVPRYQDTLYRLCLHHAIMRRDTTVKTRDLRYAHEIVFPLFSLIISWLESDTELSKIPEHEVKYLKAIHRVYRDLEKEANGWITATNFTKALRPRLQLTLPTIYRYIDIFTDRGFIEKFTKGRTVWYRLPKVFKQQQQLQQQSSQNIGTTLNG